MSEPKYLFRATLTRSRALCLVGLLALGAVGCHKATPEERMAEAVQLLNTQQTARGVLKLKEIVREYPQDTETANAHMLLARYYVSEGNGMKALEELEAIYNGFDFTDPRVQNAIEGIVSIRSQLKDYEKAIAFLDEVAARYPETDVASRAQRMIDKADVLISWGDQEKVNDAVEMLQEMMLDNEEPVARGLAREHLANYYRQQENFEMSNQVYQQYLSKYPDDSIRPRLEMAIANNLYAMGKIDESNSYFDPAAKKIQEQVDEELDKNKRTQMLMDLSSMYQSVERYDDAEKLLRRVMDENTHSSAAIQAQFSIARMYTLAGITKNDEDKFNRGIELYEQIKSENKGSNIEDNAQQLIDEAQGIYKQLKSEVERIKKEAEEGATEAAEQLMEDATEAIKDAEIAIEEAGS